MTDSRAEYFKNRRREKKNFSVYLDKDKIEKLEEKLESQSMSKTEWLEDKIGDEIFDWDDSGCEDDNQDGIDMTRKITCPYCRKIDIIDLSDFVYDTSYDENRGMGTEIVYSFEEEEHECPRCGKAYKISGWISEYPVGAFNYEDIKIEEIDAN